MVLADTCIWCDFFSKGESRLSELLENRMVVLHSIVIGELASGNLPDRVRTLKNLQNLPRLPDVSPAQTLWMIEAQQLFGQGLQWNDFQLLASASISPGVVLWTRDQRLHTAAAHRGIAYAGE